MTASNEAHNQLGSDELMTDEVQAWLFECFIELREQVPETVMRERVLMLRDRGCSLGEKKGYQ